MKPAQAIVAAIATYLAAAYSPAIAQNAATTLISHYAAAISIVVAIWFML